MTILITGGCGYIGSHLVKQLSEKKEDLIVLDNLTTGFLENLLYNETIIKTDLNNTEALDNLFETYKIDSVIHFAASIIVSESMANPLKYYLNNTSNNLNLLNTCIKHKVKNFIFSSTAAVYSPTDSGIAEENSFTNPVSPYGKSKLLSEIIIKDLAEAYNFNYAILRYFNVAGADPSGRIGQRLDNATHLIKIACEVALGKREYIEIFGIYYNTPDKTCQRDFIHVEDLANAHTYCLDYLKSKNQSIIVNVGYGKAYSVKQVLETIEKVSGKKLNIKISDRREGDLEVLIANNNKLKNQLGWKPKYDNLEKIIIDSLNWEKKLSGKTIY